MTRRVLVSPSLPKSGNAEIDRWVERSLRPHITQVFEQFSYLLREPEFIAPTFENSWANYGSGYNDAGYYKDPFGRVHLRGLVQDGTTAAVAFTLPDGYRPSGAGQFMVLASDDTEAYYHAAFLLIATNGAVSIHDTNFGDPTGSGIGWVSLEGVSFAAV